MLPSMILTTTIEWNIIITSPSNDAVSILLGYGNENLSTPFTAFAGARLVDIVVGNVNGDDQAGLGIANYDNSSISVLLVYNNGSSASETTFPTGFSPASLAIRDFNGDGLLDLTVTNNANGTVSILLNTCK
jgi:hypothetical protein